MGDRSVLGGSGGGKHRHPRTEFLAPVVLPGNRTVLNGLEPIIASAYRSGKHPSFGDPAPSLPVSEARLTAESPHPRTKMAPTVLDPARSLPELSAPVVGRILLNMVELLGTRDNFTSRQMLEIIDHELGRDQRREEPAGHPLRRVGPIIRGSNLRPIHAPRPGTCPAA
ncbi:hypothetical protein ACOM2C_19485 [Pseudarthrobacter sp. So.54]